jgi:TrmH family RNA methyltransferase
LTEALGARHPDVKRLRALARDRAVRADEALCVLEGPRVVDGALDRGARFEAVYFADRAHPAFRALVERLERAGVSVVDCRDGVLESVGTTRTPQPVIGLVHTVGRRLDSVGSLGPGGFVLVALDVADPGNLGTMVRSAEAAGAVGIVIAGDSVEAHNPKVVRSSAGALFGLPVIEHHDAGEVFAAVRAVGRVVIGTRARDGRAPDALDLTRPCALVLGNEARGVPPDAPVDEWITIPMAGAAESLNVAMAATVVCFEAARQIAAAGGPS